MANIGFNSFLCSMGLKETFNFEKCFIEHIKLYKKSRKLFLLLRSNNIIHLEVLDRITKELKRNLQIIEQVDIKSTYDIQYNNIEHLINLNQNNILYLFEKAVPSSKALLSNLILEPENNKLIIKMNDLFIVQKAKERNLPLMISDYFSENFNEKITCLILTDKDAAFNKENYEKEKEIKNIFYIDKLKKETGDSLNKSNIKSSTENIVLMGKKFTGEAVKIQHIGNDPGRVIVEGEIFQFNYKQLNNGQKMLLMQITDYTNSINVKVFELKGKDINLEDKLKEGQTVRIKGDMVYDKYTKENIIMATDILFIPAVMRTDTASEKRAELHLHTQMSAMDGVGNVKELIKRASKWGHSAVAITDHGNVQAFPDAMEAGKKHGIKIIYGMEGYVINDETQIVKCEEDRLLSDEFVVFDIETTGLSCKNDKITEIGAVKIKNGIITEVFGTLVNPKVHISEKITELTGITNEMVKDAPEIEPVLRDFLNFAGESCLVAHNADFDMGFIRENADKSGLKVKNSLLDTLILSRVLLKNIKKHKLNSIAKELNITMENHHRAVDDAKTTAEILIKLFSIMNEKGIYSLKDINEKLSSKIDYSKLNTYHVTILVQNKTGLKNLYKIVSESHMNYFYKKPRIPKSLLNKYREGLILGTACEAGELFQAYLGNKPPEEIHAIAKYYDFLEIQPLKNNEFLVKKGIVSSLETIEKINKEIVKLGEVLNIPITATGDVHFLDEKDNTFRNILMAGQGYSDADEQAPLFFKTTDEMLKEFEYLGKENAYKAVIENPNYINNKIEPLMPIPEGTFPPVIAGSDEELARLCNEKAEKIYGSPLPGIVKYRLDKELNSIISNGYAVMYIIAHKLVSKSLKDGYLVGSRGSVGSSFAATMSDITEVNPLPPHYICAECKYSQFITDGSYGCGADLPDKQCPDCQSQMLKEGYDIPFEVFLGFEGDKEPDIDLNFAGEYQSEAHKYTEELFGKGKVYRAGTIGTIADKTAYGFVKKYMEENKISCSSAEINRLTAGCTGVKRTSGQHPGGIMIVPENMDIHDFCPIQYPANDSNSGVIITHFDYHSISGRLLKLDILGHDVPTIIKMLEDMTGVNARTIPLDDPKTMQLFTGTEILKINSKELDCNAGTLGIPEFGTKFVRQMLADTNPSTFSELIRISGLSHGTDVWINNAQDIVKSNTAQLKDVISTRDDIMNYLILKGLPSKAAFKIMENVRKGKGLKPEEENLMKEYKIPQWYIDSCNKIKYMFPKAHAVAYVMMSYRIAYFKVHYPEAFYAAYFTMKAEDFDSDLIVKGKETIRKKIKDLEKGGNSISAKEKNLYTVLEVALEMYLRNIELLPVDLYESDSDKFIIKGNKLLPPLKSLQGVGQNAARSITEARKDGEFISLEDLRLRTKVTKTVIETFINHGCIEDLPKTNQLSLF